VIYTVRVCELSRLCMRTIGLSSSSTVAGGLSFSEVQLCLSPKRVGNVARDSGAGRDLVDLLLLLLYLFSSCCRLRVDSQRRVRLLQRGTSALRFREQLCRSTQFHHGSHRSLLFFETMARLPRQHFSGFSSRSYIGQAPGDMATRLSKGHRPER